MKRPNLPRGTRTRIFCTTMIVLCCILARFASAADKTAGRTFTLAVIPQMPAVTMFKNWSPVAERLSQETGVTIRLKVYEKMSDFETDCRKGIPDFIYASPPLTVIARKVQGYEPLVRNKTPVAGVVFVRKDSAFRSIRDLEGRDVAFVGSRNVCSIYIRHALGSSGLRVNVKKRFAGSTQNVFEHVIRGTVDAGGTLDMALSRSMANVREQVRVIYSTQRFAPHPLSAHPRVPAQVRAAVVRAVFKMHESDEGRSLLAAVRLSKPVRADYERDYGLFEGLDLAGLMGEE